MNIDSLRLPKENQLLEDYHDRFQSSMMHSFFSYDPWAEKSYHERYAYLRSERPKSLMRKELIHVIRSHYGDERLHPKLEKNLIRFADEKSCVVIGGHQACLLTGPLYTLYKAVTIIQLAAREEKRLGVPVIPIFWIAGEDHDYEEVNHIWIRDTKEKITKQSFSSDPMKMNRLAISSIEFDQVQMKQWIEQLSQQLPDTPFKKEWIQKCKHMITSVRTWSQLFASLMRTLFDQWGLVLIDASDHKLRQLESKFFIQLIEQNEEISQQLQKHASMLEGHHYHLPVHLEPNHAHLFIDIADERFPLFRHGELWMTRDGLHRFSQQELLQIAEETPERLSNNVLTRPLMQEYLFPTLIFVGGPGEIAYWSLLKSTFSAVNLQMPIVYPRLQLTLVDQTAWKRMKAYDLNWDDVLYHFAQRKSDWLRKQEQIDLSQLFQSVDHQLDEIYRSIIDTLKPELGTHFEEIGQKNRKRTDREFAYLHQYALRMFEDKHQHELRQLDQIAVRLVPLEKRQERVYNLIQFWNEFGLDWLDDLIDSPLITEGNDHLFVRI